MSAFSQNVILGDGLLGTALSKMNVWDIISRKSHHFNIDDFDSYSTYLNSYGTIVNCIANTDTYSNDKDSMWKVNYKFPYELALYCKEKRKKLVHISTDYLYTNSIPNASEENVPIHGNNWYSYTKLLADGAVQLVCDNYLICRCTHKPYPFPYDRAWVNQVGNFDYVNIIASNITKLIALKANGVYNVGTEIKSMYDLAKRTKPNVIPILINNSEIPTNTSMDISKMNNIFNENLHNKSTS
jgi:dTDP-4-dehydrorhamnose reductase